MVKKLLGLAIALLLVCAPAFASQNSTALPLSGIYSGLTAAGIINGGFDTTISNFSGNSAPGTPTSYQYWADTTTSVLKFYDGSTWLPMGKFTGSQWAPISNGVVSTAAVSTGSANAYVVTLAPAPSAYVTGQQYAYIANFANTGAATVNYNSLGAKTIKKNFNVDLATNDIKSGQGVLLQYDGTNMQLVGQLGNSSSGGTVTSITCNGGLSGGAITASGTCALAAIANNTVLANVSGGSAAPIANTPSAVLEGICATQGAVMYYNGSNWVCLGVGSTGQTLTTQGAGANPIWASPSNTVNIQTFNSTGTWTKPAVGTKTLAECWGAGGGGGRGQGSGGAGSGGGGGGYNYRWYATASLGTTEAVSVGAGGAAQGSLGNGNAGGNTTFSSSSNLLTAYGATGGCGNNGVQGGGGGGGGILSAGGTSCTSGGNVGGAGESPAGGAAGSPGADGNFGGGGGGNGGGQAGGKSGFGGGGGGGGNTGTGGAGGASVYGAGAGGGAGSVTGGAGGTSVYAGGGGSGASGAAGTAGTQPGGGGGGGISGAGAAGADGRCIVTTW